MLPQHSSKDLAPVWLLGFGFVLSFFLLSSSNLFLKAKDKGTGICPVAQQPVLRMLRSYVYEPLSFVRLNVAESIGVAVAFSLKIVAFKKTPKNNSQCTKFRV